MMKTENTRFVPIHAVEYAHERRHFPAQGKWRVPVDYLGKGFRYFDHVEIETRHPVLSDGFVSVVRDACQREKAKGYLIEVDSSNRVRARYTRAG
jgi:hypothetical protein